jgi:hypothetical protein
MTEAPDVYPEFPAGDEPDEPDDEGVEGALDEGGRGQQTDQVRTGDRRVDAVLESLEGLDELPVSEHAGVFERAHEGLRAALDPQRESA